MEWDAGGKWESSRESSPFPGGICVRFLQVLGAVGHFLGSLNPWQGFKASKAVNEECGCARMFLGSKPGFGILGRAGWGIPISHRMRD